MPLLFRSPRLYLRHGTIHNLGELGAKLDLTPVTSPAKSVDVNIIYLLAKKATDKNNTN